MPKSINHELNFSGRRRLTVITQTEATECGLACLAMVAHYHGHDIDLNGLRQKLPVSLKGASLNNIIDMAAQLDLGSRALRLELEEISQLQTPCILHWDLNHYVVLKKVAGKRVHIHDPATGMKILGLNELSEHFSGVALELAPTSGFTKQTARQKMHLSQLWGKLIGLKRATAHLLTLSIVLQLTVLVSPFYLQLVVDETIANFDVKLLLVLALSFGSLTIIQQATTMMRDWTILYYGHQMSYQMVANILRHLIHLPTEYYEKRNIGDILSRIGSATPIQTALTQSVAAAVIDGLMAVITGIVIFLYSPLLGAIVFSSVTLLLLVTMLFYPILKRSQEEVIVSRARENTHMIESIQASIPIKLFSAQNQRMSTWRNLFADFINNSVAYGKYGILLKTLQETVTGLQTILVVYFGARLILDSDATVLFTVGMLFAFMSYRASFTNSVVSLFNKIIEFRLLGLHLDRIADIAQTENENPNKIITNKNEIFGNILIDNLRFRYSPSDPWVLDGINFKIKSGEFVVISGPSGGGKTTLLKLMLGLYKPTEGEIYIDDSPLTENNLTNWRKNIGVVMQDDQLLSGSLADNISFFEPNLDMQRIYKAAQTAQIHDTIMAMPMGYLSLIGDMGSALSGGQKQRVLLARALYKEPKILFLDEGTANLDQETELAIVDAVKALSITRIIVAHRPAFLQVADIHIEI